MGFFGRKNRVILVSRHTPVKVGGKIREHGGLFIKTPEGTVKGVLPDRPA